MDNPQTPTSRSVHKMSSGLKKKLQLLGRYHGSRPPPKLQRKTLSWSPSLGTRTTTPDSSPHKGTISSDCSPNRSLQEVTSSPESTDFLETAEKCRTFEPYASNASSPESIDEKPAKGMWPVMDLSCEDASSLSEEKASDDRRPSDENSDPAKKLAVWENRMAEKEERLRKLKMVKLYRTKNNLDDLRETIVRWRSACRSALLEYREKCQEPAPSMTDVIGHLQIDARLVRYSPEDGSFED